MKRKLSWVIVTTLLAGIVGCSTSGDSKSQVKIERTAQEQEEIEKALKWLKNKDDDVRDDAVWMIAELGAKEYANDIAALLKDKDAFVRMSTVATLAMLEAKEYTKDIAMLLKDEDFHVRGASAAAMGDLGAREYVKDIVILLRNKDEDAFVIWNAIEAIGKLGAKEYAKDISEFINNKGDESREYATEVLEGWGYKVEKQSDGTYKVIEKPEQNPKSQTPNPK